MLLMLLPFLGSGFVPTDVDARPAALVRRVPAVHADHRDAARAAARRRRSATSGLIAVAWCVAISVLGYLGARRLYERDTTSA